MERRLLAADVVGFGRLMGRDEAGTLAQLQKLRSEFIDPRIAGYQGRIVKLTGDGIPAEFPSVVSVAATPIRKTKPALNPKPCTTLPPAVLGDRARAAAPGW